MHTRSCKYRRVVHILCIISSIKIRAMGARITPCILVKVYAHATFSIFNCLTALLLSLKRKTFFFYHSHFSGTRVVEIFSSILCISTELARLEMSLARRQELNAQNKFTSWTHLANDTPVKYGNRITRFLLGAKRNSYTLSITLNFVFNKTVSQLILLDTIHFELPYVLFGFDYRPFCSYCLYSLYYALCCEETTTTTINLCIQCSVESIILCIMMPLWMHA